MALATWICFRVGFNFATTISVFLVIIVLLSLLDSLISSLIFSVIAVSILNYFFTQPLFTFYVSEPEDIAGLLAFFITSFAVTGLMRRLRQSAETLRQQALRQSAHLRNLLVEQEQLLIERLDDVFVHRGLPFVADSDWPQPMRPVM